MDLEVTDPEKNKEVALDKGQNIEENEEKKQSGSQSNLLTFFIDNK
jgi:hypothetical protein